MKLSHQSAAEPSLTSIHGFSSLVQNVSRDTQCNPDNLDQLARISAIEHSAAQVNCIITNFPQLAEPAAALESLDPQANPPLLEESVQASNKLNRDKLHTQDLEARLSHLELIQQQILQSFDLLRSSVLEYKDSIKSLTRSLAILQSSVSCEMDIMRRNVEVLTRVDNKQQNMFASGNVSQIPVTTSSAHLSTSGSIPVSSIALNGQQFSSFEPQVFQPPITTMHCPNAVHIPIYTTAPLTTRNLEMPRDGNNYCDRQLMFGAQSPYRQHHAQPARHIQQPGFQSPDYHHSRVQPSVVDHDSTTYSGPSNGSRLSALNIQERLLKGQMKGLKGLLSPSPSDELPKTTLLDLHKYRVMAVENQTNNLQRSLRDYIRSDDHCFQLCDKISNVIDNAISWSSEIRNLCQDKGLHKKSQSERLYDELAKFSPNSEIDIFSFLKRFESLTEEFDYPEERAELLYNKFLSSSVQEELFKYKSDYTQMRKILLHRYADPKTIMSNLLSGIRKEKLPSVNSDVFESLSYYRKLQSSLENINALLKSQGNSNEYLEVYITSTEFIHSLLTLVPLDAKGEFFKQMDKCSEDTLHIRGIIPFRLLISAVNEQYEFYDFLSRTTSVSQASKGIRDHERSWQVNSPHSFVQDSSEQESLTNLESDIESDISDSSEQISFTDNESDVSSDSDQGYSASQVNFQRSVKPSRYDNRPRKPIARFEFPCVLKGHQHNLSDCSEFLLRTPKERSEHRKRFKYHHCLVCLKSSDNCSYNKCNNSDSLPKILMCKHCKKDSKVNKNLRVYNTLFCFREKHQKPHNDELLAALESYIPGFKSSSLCLNSL